MFKNPARILFTLLLLSFSNLFYTPSPVYSYFVENFNGSLDNPSAWEINNTNGVSYTSSEIALSHSYPNKFPYIRTVTPIIDPLDNIIKIGFKYTNKGINFGNGIAITDLTPPLNTLMTYPDAFSQYTMFYIWHSPGNPYFHIVTFLCPSTSPGCPGSPLVIYQTASQDLNYHNIEITRSGSSYTFNLDGNIIFSSAPTARVASNIWLGHPETTGTSGVWASFTVDYIEIGLPPVATFPYLSQKDPAWAEEVYDDAEDWAPDGEEGIGRWGCTITSVAMILREYGVRALDGSEVDPSLLNDWLSSQPDGYVGKGLLNWLAITRFARQSYLAGHADTKLEFERTPLSSSPTLPSILGTAGHFVVAHDEDATDWTINDPANETITTLAKTTTLTSINRYIPSLTDLSYMLFVAEPGADVSLYNQFGDPVPLDWTEEYLVDDIDGTSTDSVLTALVPKPDDGTYELSIINSDGIAETVEVYLYDLDGGVVEDTLVIPPDTSANFEIVYSEIPNQNGPLALDPTAIFDYLKSLRQPKTSANGIFQALYSRFVELVTEEEGSADLSRFITKQSPKFVAPEVKTQLQNYIMLIDQN